MSADPLVLSRCEGCGLLYLPTAAPCPRCATHRETPVEASPLGTVLAATELASPSEGWTAPHRLVLVEVQDAVRLLAMASESIPEVGETVRVRRDGEVYRVMPTDPVGRQG